MCTHKRECWPAWKRECGPSFPLHGKKTIPETLDSSFAKRDLGWVKHLARMGWNIYMFSWKPRPPLCIFLPLVFQNSRKCILLVFSQEYSKTNMSKTSGARKLNNDFWVFRSFSTNKMLYNALRISSEIKIGDFDLVQDFFKLLFFKLHLSPPLSYGHQSTASQRSYDE